MNSMYEVIMDLPLFQGVSRDKVSELIEKTRFHFLKYKEGEVIAEAGDLCQHIRFIISGSVRLEFSSINKSVTLSEVLYSPNVIGADYLFGRDTIYPFTAYSASDCGILQIEKSDYIRILQSDKVFLFNLLNTLSRNSQKSVQGILALSTGSLAERLAFFIVSLTQRGGKEIKLAYVQKDLCTLLGVQRSSLISTLTSLKVSGTIEFTQSEILVKDRELMFEILHSPED
ncbi:MAG: Crp/Fnr family transcriptional regulator [Muribaculaceae bacterium]|nr:Crp/Fnr family transcriptional regulator [Muribaculaceae bacterium]